MSNSSKRAAGKLLIAAALLVTLAVGYKFGKMNEPAASSDDAPAAAEKQVWTCSMHPQIKLPHKGLCPICAMDLIPLATDGHSDSFVNPATLSFSENAQALMEIEVAVAQRKFVTADVRMTGKIDYNETRLSNITAWTSGRLDKLYVDYTGVPVKKGDHMVYMYSPDLISAQEEFLGAAAAAKNIAAGDSKSVRDMTKMMADAAREKLLLLGLTPEQVRQIETDGKVSDHLTIYAPTGGIVIQKDAVEGMYVQTGTKIYTVADMSKLWANLDAYESDMEWLRYGQQVKFTSVSYPGHEFEGVISFIAPFLNERTRTVKVRLDVDNSDGRLKPGMFIKAVVKAEVAAGGRVMDAGLAGKWICPMHPEIVKKSADSCDICGMPLVTTESLGYVSDDTSEFEKPLVIPVSAALVTGTRAVVYVKLPDTEKPTYEGREVVLGPRAGDYYIIRGGLTEGELVVVKGNFKIDSSLQIMAAPSMMNPAQHADAEAHKKEMPLETASPDKKITSAFRDQLAAVFGGYFQMHKTLAADDFDGALKAVKDVSANLAKVDMMLLEGDAHKKWMKLSVPLKKAFEKAADAKDIKAIRADFHTISQQTAKIAGYFGSPIKAPMYRQNCPMAFNNTGADWLAQDKAILNPYFGSGMLRCGDVEEVIEVKQIWQEDDK